MTPSRRYELLDDGITLDATLPADPYPYEVRESIERCVQACPVGLNLVDGMMPHHGMPSGRGVRSCR